MKKLLTSLIILTLIVSSFSVVSFADGEKVWNLSTLDFSSSNHFKAVSNTKWNKTIVGQWYGKSNHASYDATNKRLSVFGSGISSNSAAARMTLTTAPSAVGTDNEQYLVAKAQIFPGDVRTRFRISLDKVDANGNDLSEITSNTLFTVDGAKGALTAQITKPSAIDSGDNINGNGIVPDYYNDGWVDCIAVIDMNKTNKNLPITVYYNGTKATSTLHENVAYAARYGTIFGLMLQNNQASTGSTYVDDTGIYTVSKSNLPALTASLNELTFTTSNEVTLANLSKDTTTSLVKLNGEYLPLSTIKAHKGGLSFEIDESVIGYGDNVIDISEVKDIFGSNVSGTNTFTITKEMPSVDVSEDAIINEKYDNGKGTGTKTARFFADIEALDVAEAGFEVSATVGGVKYTWEIALSEVYKEVVANDVTYNATNYILTGALGDVPADFEDGFEVKVYTKNYEGIKSYR